MAERSRRPKYSPNQTKPETEARIVEQRKQRPDWGAMKLHYLLKQESPELSSLSVRTVQRVIERHHFVNDEDRPAAPALRRFERQHPNELWQMDFKGPQGFNKACAVGPLSILDDHSHYLIALEQLSSTKAQGAKQTLRRCLWTMVRRGGTTTVPGDLPNSTCG